jgi:hypothetical protein
LASTFSTVATLSSATVKLSSLAVGGSFTGVTVTVTAAVEKPPLPSEIVYVNVVTPLKSSAGVKLAGARPATGSTGRPSPSPQAREGKAGQCPYCNTRVPKLIRSDTRCERCRSPLSAPPQLGGLGRELFGRRATPRIAKSHFATIHPTGQPQSMTVKMRDLSLTGLSFYAEIDLEIGQVFKFRDTNLEAVAAVVSRGKRGQWYSIHARLLTVAFHQPGVFVSASQ